MSKVLTILPLNNHALIINLIFKQFTYIGKYSSRDKYIHINGKVVAKELVHLFTTGSGYMYHTSFMGHEAYFKIRTAQKCKWNFFKIFGSQDTPFKSYFPSFSSFFSE